MLRVLSRIFAIDKDMIVQDVYVSKGDSVKKGDKLVSFDMTLVQMELKIAKLKQEQQEQNLAQGTETSDKPSEWRTG